VFQLKELERVHQQLDLFGALTPYEINIINSQIKESYIVYVYSALFQANIYVTCLPDIIASLLLSFSQ
jgi:hypothetical protein